MEAELIVATALKLQCTPPENALRFAHMIAEHCAQLVEECPPDSSVTAAAQHIRTQFFLEVPSRI